MVTTISGADQNPAMKQSAIHTDFHEISMKSIWAKIYVLSEFALGWNIALFGNIFVFVCLSLE